MLPHLLFLYSYLKYFFVPAIFSKHKLQTANGILTKFDSHVIVHVEFLILNYISYGTPITIFNKFHTFISINKCKKVETKKFDMKKTN